MITRRDFLKVLGAFGIATQIPELALKEIEAAPLAPVTEEFTHLFDGQMFRISFQDGATYQFKGMIQSLGLSSPVDSLQTAEVKVRPMGPIEVVQEAAATPTPQKGIALGGHGTTITRDGEPIGELIEIELPKLERHAFDFTDASGDSYVIPGLRRTSDLTFSVTLNPSDNRGFEKLLGDMKQGG